MTLLPIVGRELRVGSRELRLYWGRVVAAALALLLGVLVYSVNSEGNVASLSQAMFMSLAWLAWLFCLTAGARLTSDAISSERREGTLGLLFLTDLRSYDIVLGKMAANSLHSLYGLLAIVPVLALPLLMGGVAMQQVLRVALVLLVTLLFSLSAGMFVSCWFENGRRALGGTMLLLVLCTLGPFGLMLLPLMGSGPGPAQPDYFLATPSPLMAQALAATPAGTGKPDELFWPSVACVTALGLGWLLGACLALPRLWRALPRLLPVKSRDAKSPPNRKDERRRMHRQRLLDLNPFYWLTCRSPYAARRVVYVFIGLGLLWAWFTAKAELFDDDGWAITTSLLLHVILKVWVAIVAVQQLSEERRTGSMELLLSTPLTVRQIIGGQMRGMWRRFGPVFALVLVADLLLLFATRSQSYADRDLLSLMGTCHMVALGVDSVALILLGMWSALRTRNANQASGGAFFKVIALPCVVFVGGMMLEEFLNLDRRWGLIFSETEVLLGFYLLCLVNDVAWAAFAWDRLNRRFREVAAQRFTKGGGWLAIFRRG